MESVFGSLGKVLYTDNHGHCGFLIKWRLVTPFIKKWSRNREPDQVRIEEMFRYRGYFPCIIHLAELPDEGVVCYDGNHRREVFNEIADNDFECIVDIMFGATQSDVYTAFDNINKSVQLPALYLEPPSASTDDIIKLVKTYESNYKPFLSHAQRFRAPQFNRDVFTDNIHTIYKDLNGSQTIEQIGKLLIKLNDEYSKGFLCKDHSEYSPNVIDKCRKYNMWLFLEGTVPTKHIKIILKSPFYNK